MGQDTKIEWCHATFNPWRGCTKVSAGCTHCYAETMSHRNPKVLGVWGDGGTRVVASEAAWREPPKWDRAAAKAGERHRVFCASLADVFEDWQGPMVVSDGDDLWACRACDRVATRPLLVSSYSSRKTTEDCPICGERMAPCTMADIRRSLFAMIRETPNLDWLMLTKRPENLGRLWSAGTTRENVWLMTTVESEEQLGRIDALKSHGDKAAVLGLSIEPLLGPMPTLGEYLDGIDWVIVGGESGPKARPMHPDWARSIRDQCVAAGVPFLFKQWGEWIDASETLADGSKIAGVRFHKWGEGCYSVWFGKKHAGRHLDGRTWDEFPEVSHA